MSDEPIWVPNSVGDAIRKFWSNALRIIGYFAFVSGAGLLAYQIYDWLRHAEWRPLTIFAAVKRCLPMEFSQWYVQHVLKDWAGVSRIVDSLLSLSLWWILIVMAFPLILWGDIIRGGIGRKKRKV